VSNFSHPIHATCPARFTVLDIITQHYLVTNETE